MGKLKKSWDAADMASDEEKTQVSRRTNDVTSTGVVVGANIARIRKARGMSTYRLAEALAAVDRPIAQSQISRIEAGKRKVDVDDLMAFAVALKVSPSALLLEPSMEGYQEVTSAGIIRSEIAWQWLYGERPLEEDLPPHDDGQVWNDFQTMSRPPGRRSYRNDQHYNQRDHVQRGVGGHPRPPAPGAWPKPDEQPEGEA